VNLEQPNYEMSNYSLLSLLLVMIWNYVWKNQQNHS